MPIYEYSCPKCHKTFEEFTSILGEHSTANCPDCGSLSPRVLSETSFILKGGGWYVTDYGSKKGIKDQDSSETGSTSSPAAQTTNSASKAETSASTPSNT